MPQDKPKAPIRLEAQRQAHHCRTLDFVARLLDRRELQHLIVITQVPGCDIQIHSSWSSKTEELWLLSRAQHMCNRVIDGDEESAPHDDGAG